MNYEWPIRLRMPRFIKRCFKRLFFFKYTFFFVNCNIRTRVVSVFHDIMQMHFWITDSVRISSRRLDRLAETSRRFETVSINYIPSGGGDSNAFPWFFFSFARFSVPGRVVRVHAVKTYWNALVPFRRDVSFVPTMWLQRQWTRIE